MNHDDDEKYWTAWQRNDRIPGEHRSAVYDDDPDEAGGVVFWLFVLVFGFVVLGIVALRFGHLLWSRQ